MVITLPVMLLPLLKDVFELISSHVERAFKSAAVVMLFGVKAGQQGVGEAQVM